MSILRGTMSSRHMVGIVRRFLIGVVLAILIAALGIAVFIGVECYGAAADVSPRAHAPAAPAANIDDYTREEASTFLTLPEWYIVYNTEEYSRFIGSRGPSGFPHLGSIRQFWRYYGAVCEATQGAYQFSSGNHLMLAVIGSSFSVENALKGLYENMVGRVTEWLGGHQTEEDRYAHATAVEYAAFMHTVPWYEFPFRARLTGLWTGTSWVGRSLIRKWERKLALTGEYGAKAMYAWLIRRASKATYGNEDLRIFVSLDNAPDEIFADGMVVKIRQLGPRSFIVTLPRYEAFTTRALMLFRQGVHFLDIAGNDEILLTALVPARFDAAETGGTVILRERLITDDMTDRLGLRTPVRLLHATVARLEAGGAKVEHLYDY